MLIKSTDAVMAKMNRGAELTRGAVGGWYLYRGTVRIGRVLSAVAEEVISSGRVVRADDRTSVVGETYKVCATDRALLECERAR